MATASRPAARPANVHSLVFLCLTLKKRPVPVSGQAFCGRQLKPDATSTEAQPAFRAFAALARHKAGIAGRADGGRGMFIKHRIRHLQVALAQPGSRQILLFKYRNRLLGIDSSDLQLEIRTTSALGAATRAAIEQGRDALFSQKYLVGFQIPELSLPNGHQRLAFGDLHGAGGEAFFLIA